MNTQMRRLQEMACEGLVFGALPLEQINRGMVEIKELAMRSWMTHLVKPRQQLIVDLLISAINR